jgi:hypothetical protein
MNQKKFNFTHFLIILSLVLIKLETIRAESSTSYSFKLQSINGSVYPHDKQIKKLIDNPVTGLECSVDFQTLGNKPWHYYNNYPIVGIGAVWLNLGNQSLLGHAFALYPYINYNLWDTKYFKLRIKGGMGASYLTKTYYNTNTDNFQSLQSGNSAIGSNLNVFFSGGASLEIPIIYGISFTADYTWNHMSNGSVVVPNSGLNLLNIYSGIKYTPNYKSTNKIEQKDYQNLSRAFKWECLASGGIRQLYYQDDKSFAIGSISIGIYKPLTNFYQMGIGLDGFYDGVYNGNTKFKRTYLKSDELSNKLRAGLSWRHELLIGKITAGIHLGLYLYDPLKNASPYNDAIGNSLNKGIVYPYNIDDEDGWLYTRATIKYALTNHLIFAVGLKTHLQKAEFIEWGVGYQF